MPAHDFEPQLATLVTTPPEGDEWVHEIKLDGYRIGCRLHGGRATLLSRNGNDWTRAFPDIARAAERLDAGDALLDGEVAVVLPDGRTSFQAIQNASRGAAAEGRLVYFVFDLLRLHGKSLVSLPLDERKARLRSLLGRRVAPIRYSEHVEGRGRDFFDQACRLKLEGIVSKRRDLPYQPGRHGGWLKTKCSRRQEFVIGGFTDPEGTRAGLGALLIGVYEDNRLVFSGRVGTGFTQRGAVDLRKRLDALEVKTCPFSPPPDGALARVAHWVKPHLVCEVAFAEWTSDGKVRHPSFQGLREDKQPREVTRERPSPSAAAAAEDPVAAPARARGGRTAVAGVGISHPERVLYPDPPFTKLDLARYYERVADWILPHIKGRPLTLVRCPDGIGPSCFYAKHSLAWAPPALRRVRIQERTKIGEYLVADDLAGLISLAQMDVLEIHTWNSTMDDVEHPDRLVFDLDPGTDVAWTQIVDAAISVRGVLEALDLESFPKTTGGRGVHVVVPLRPHAAWPDCLEFARVLSERIAAADPGRYTTQFAKSGRSRKILIDYLRNNRTNTSIAAYSTRARAGATVSVPLRWDELRRTLDPSALTAVSVPQRLARQRVDPWKGYWTSRQRLTRERIRAAGGK